ncbi:MAG: DUF4279 domain-containing protein [Candidatus Cybelea sp.]
MKQYVQLSLMGIDPKTLTERLGIQPTAFAVAGQERRPGVFWRHHRWELRTDAAETEFDTEAHFRKLLEQIRPHINAIRELKDVEKAVSWVVEVGPDEQTPIGVISPGTLAALHEIGVHLNVSLYFDAGSGFVETVIPFPA